MLNDSGRQKCEERAAERQEYRIWRACPAGRGRQDDGGDEQHEQLFRLTHATLQVSR